MYNNNPTRVLTGEVRLSYVNLVEPQADRLNPSAPPKYTVTLLIPKSDVAVKQNIDASIEAAATEAQSKIWSGVRPPTLDQPVHDGDGLRANGTPFGPECKGCWVVTAKSKNKPQVVSQNDINTELLPQDIYSGMYARVTISFFGYNANGKRGIGCGLGNVMKTRDGEPLAGNVSAAADFAGVGQTIAAPQAQAAWGQPVATPAAQTAPAQNTWAGAVQAMQAESARRINPLTGQPM